jgi:hypothetical protein
MLKYICRIFIYLGINFSDRIQCITIHSLSYISQKNSQNKPPVFTVSASSGWSALLAQARVHSTEIWERKQIDICHVPSKKQHKKLLYTSPIPTFLTSHPITIWCKTHYFDQTVISHAKCSRHVCGFDFLLCNINMRSTTFSRTTRSNNQWRWDIRLRVLAS